jgi:hypothetical protein
VFRLQPLDEYPVISQEDPAIDLEKSNIEEYKKTLDQKHLVFKLNEKPTVFWLKPLTVHQRARINGALVSLLQTRPGNELTYKESYRAAEFQLRQTLSRVENCMFGDSEFKLNFDDEGLVSSESMANLVSPDLIFELSNHVRDISQIPPVTGQSDESK